MFANNDTDTSLSKWKSLPQRTQEKLKLALAVTLIQSNSNKATERKQHENNASKGNSSIRNEEIVWKDPTTLTSANQKNLIPASQVSSVFEKTRTRCGIGTNNIFTIRTQLIDFNATIYTYVHQDTPMSWDDYAKITQKKCENLKSSLESYSSFNAVMVSQALLRFFTQTCKILLSAEYYKLENLFESFATCQTRYARIKDGLLWAWKILYKTCLQATIANNQQHLLQGCLNGIVSSSSEMISHCCEKLEVGNLDPWHSESFVSVIIQVLHMMQDFVEYVVQVASADKSIGIHPNIIQQQRIALRQALFSEPLGLTRWAQILTTSTLVGRWPILSLVAISTIEKCESFCNI